MYHVLLYYKIIPIAHPEKHVEIHTEVCRALGLKGRVLIGKDGLNGTVAGTQDAIGMYRAYMGAHRVFKQIDFKASTSDVEPFPKLKVKVRHEIITTATRENFDLNKRARHVDRDTFHTWLVRGEDMLLVDMRNDYEWAIGRFKGALCPHMKNFRELKDNMAWYKEQYAHKKIVTYCTGGVRCEPATALLIAEGFDPKNMFQLEGGIVKYAEKYGDEGFFEGKCFVFDERIAVPIDTSEQAVIVSQCIHCHRACDTYRNCLNKICNRLHIACDVCYASFDRTCSDSCKVIIRDEAMMRPTR